MAYLRDEKENLEVSYPLGVIWAAIPKAVKKLEWEIQETDEAKHQVKIKTRGAFLSYGSAMSVDLIVVNEKTTRMTVTAETPVTTITAMADYGRTGERVSVFIETLAKLLSGEK